MEKNYDINLKDEVLKKIKSINKVRNARISASERMRHYSKNWGRIFLIFNLIAILFVITAIAKIISKEFEDQFSVVTSIFSLYVIIIQYYINGKNYGERSLRLHYHQLELEKNILDLKALIFKLKSEGRDNDNFLEDVNKYKMIMKDYQNNLLNIENHTDMDFKKGNMELNCWENLKFKMNLGIISNYLFCLILVGFYIYVLWLK